MASEIVNHEISRAALLEKMRRGDKLVIVDVLPSAYFRHSHLPGALSLPLQGLALGASEILTDKRALIVVYCQNQACPAAQEAAQILWNLGYENVREFKGGKDEWRQAGLKLEGRSRALRK